MIPKKTTVGIRIFCYNAVCHHPRGKLRDCSNMNNVCLVWDVVIGNSVIVDFHISIVIYALTNKVVQGNEK